MTKTWGTEESPVHHTVRGFDSNALYSGKHLTLTIYLISFYISGMLAGNLGTGFPTVWKRQKEFFVKQKTPNTESSYYEMEYSLFTEYVTSTRVVHAFNGGQVTFGHRNFRPDVWIPEQNRVDLFNGCYIHMHSERDKTCTLKPKNPRVLTEEAKKRLKKDQEALDYYTSQGLFVNEV